MLRERLAAKFWARVEKSEGCWLWLGPKTWQGYGKSGMNCDDGHHEQLAHRKAYVLSRGAIPAGLVIDHLCRNPSCVRPDHLEPVTAYVNNHVRGKNQHAMKTECSKGHPFDEANIYRDPRGYRGCRQCRKEAAIRHYASIHTQKQDDGRSPSR